MLLGDDNVATVTLTTLIGCETDEPVGNDSYIGALASVNNKDYLIDSKGYYALGRHQEVKQHGLRLPTRPQKLHAALLNEPVRFNVQTKIASLLNQYMKTTATDVERRETESIPLAFEVQSFRIADGSLRYYARAEWKRGQKPNAKAAYVVAAWMTPMPTLKVLAVETRTSSYDFQNELPNLLNVVDLGGGRSGMIVSISGDDSRSLSLIEYRDGVSLRDMRVLQSIGMGE